MSFKSFVTCHCHPQSLDTASTPEEFLKKEEELGTNCLTVTDHGTLQAVRKIYDLAKSKKFTPILGIEAYFRDDNCPILKSFGIDDAKTYAKYYHVTIHLLDQNAYEVVSRLLSRADATAEHHGSERKPIFGWKELEEIGAANTTIGSGCLVGMVQRHVSGNQERPDIAKAYYDKLKAITQPGNFYVEIFPHCCDKNWVSGVFVELSNGRKLKVYGGKKFKTNVGEIAANDLALDFNKAANRHFELLAVKNYSTWEEIGSGIVSVERIEDFVQNECRPYAPEGDAQLGANRFMLELALANKDTVLISDDSHFAYPDKKIVQDIRLLTYSGESWRFSSSYHRQSSEEAFDYFKNKMDIGEKQFEQWVDNSYQWSSRFRDFSFNYPVSLPTKFYPEDTLAHTFKLIEKHGRMNWKDPKYVERLQKEIALLHENGVVDLLPYFFIDEEICAMYAEKGLLCGVGRGSASGALLAYLLNITHLDPIKNDLSLERFITIDRIKAGKFPDIDQDLPEREILVGAGDGGWLKERFGDHCAQISADTSLKLKSSAKDVARVLNGKVDPEHEEIIKKFRVPPQGVSDQAFVFGYKDGDSWIPGSIENDTALQTYIKKYPREWEIVQKALALQRSKTRHACAFVVCNRPVHEFLPLMSISEVQATQFTHASVEAMGGVKMDFLRLNTLVDISKCLQLLRTNKEVPQEITIDGKKVPTTRLVPFNGQWHDVWDLPELEEVFRDITGGDTETVFQLNTSSAKKWLECFKGNKSDGKPVMSSVEDISIFTALDRPGPLDSYVDGNGLHHNMMVEYARRAKGEKPIGLEEFRGLIPETHDLLVYQESVQKIYQYFTDCSLTEAEGFRQDVGKKKKEKILKAHANFVEKAAKLRLSGDTASAEKIWNALISWSAYGFCIDEDQEVQTISGSKKIKDLTTQDLVATLDPSTNTIHYEPPEAVWQSGEKEVYEVEFEDGSKIRGTLDHEFLYQGEWVALNDIIFSARQGEIYERDPVSVRNNSNKKHTKVSPFRKTLSTPRKPKR